MKLEITAIGKFQKYFPSRTTIVDFPGSTLPELLRWMKEKHGLDPAAHRNLKITRNSVMVREFDLTLEEGDKIGFIPIVAGG